VTDAGQILIELSTGIKLFGTEKYCGFEFRELIIIKKLTPYNCVTQAGRKMSGRYLVKEGQVIVYVKGSLYKCGKNDETYV
jgi:hypothetical protein